MNEKGIVKSNIICIALVVVVSIIVLFFVLGNKNKEVEYFSAKGNKATAQILIKDTKELNKLIKDLGGDFELTSSTTYSKYMLSERYNENYFLNGKIAIISLYEDDSKGYIQTIDEIVYNETRTEATINYTDRTDGYAAGRLSQTWFNYFIVELEPTVTQINFVKANLNKTEE